MRLRRSGIHGKGLFALRDIPKGTRIIEYTGRRITKAASDRLVDEQWARGRIYVFEVTRRYDLDGDTPTNLAKFVNHSCEPNAESDVIRGRVWILALRDVAKGEEVAYDYNFDFDEHPQPCSCGAAACRGWIVGEDEVAKLRRWLRRRGRG